MKLGFKSKLMRSLFEQIRYAVESYVSHSQHAVTFPRIVFKKSSNNNPTVRRLFVSRGYVLVRPNMGVRSLEGAARVLPSTKYSPRHA